MGHTWQVYDRRYSQLCESFSWSDARDHQQLRRVNCTRGEDDLAVDPRCALNSLFDVHDPNDAGLVQSRFHRIAFDDQSGYGCEVNHSQILSATVLLFIIEILIGYSIRMNTLM